jgi:hypothetical protein
MNHFAAVCNKKNEENNEDKKKKHIRKKKVYEIAKSDVNSSSNDSGSDLEDDKVQIFKIMDNSGSGGSVKASLKLRFNEVWKVVMCEIDTAVCLIGYKKFCELYESNCTVLSTSKFKLRAFGGTDIKTLGQKNIRCIRKGVKYDILFQVVDTDHGPLLSANASKILGLVKYCNEVKINVNTHDKSHLKCNDAQIIVNKYKTLFEGYGCLNEEVDLEIDHNVQPSIQAPRRIAVSLREDLKKELNKMVNDGIIVKEEESTEWVSNILLTKCSVKETTFSINHFG